MAKARALGLVSALASASLVMEEAFADGPFQFSPFSPAPQAGPAPPPETPPKEETRVRNDNPRTTAAGFDPEALERGAAALREINKSRDAKKVGIFLYFECPVCYLLEVLRFFGCLNCEVLQYAPFFLLWRDVY